MQSSSSRGTSQSSPWPEKGSSAETHQRQASLNPAQCAAALPAQSHSWTKDQNFVLINYCLWFFRQDTSTGPEPCSEPGGAGTTRSWWGGAASTWRGSRRLYLEHRWRIWMNQTETSFTAQQQLLRWLQPKRVAFCCRGKGEGQLTSSSLAGPMGEMRPWTWLWKLDKSWEPCHRQGITFLPLAVESLGAWHPSAVAEVKRLGSALARHTGEEESSTICRLFQKLSVCLVRGSAALFNNRSPPDEAALGDEIVWWSKQLMCTWYYSNPVIYHDCIALVHAVRLLITPIFRREQSAVVEALPSYGRKKQWYSVLLQPLRRRRRAGGRLECTMYSAPSTSNTTLPSTTTPPTQRSYVHYKV